MQDKKQLDLIISLFSNGKVQGALDQLDPLIKNNPKDAVLFNIKGACFAQIGEPIMAMKQYEKAVEIDLNYSEAYSNLGITLQELDELEKALENFEKAFSLKPEKVEIINIIISILNELNDAKISIDYYQKIIKSSPEHYLVHFNLGTLYQNLGHSDDAVNSYKQAIKLQPEFVDAFLNLGIIMEETGKLDEALKNLERANEINPDNPLILNNLGITLEGLDRKDDAIVQFERAIEIDPNDPSSFYNLGITLRDKNRDYAIKNFEKAIEINPKNGEFYSQLGALHLQAKHHNKGLLNLDKAFSINPDIDFLIGNRLYTKMQLALWDDFNEQINILSNKIENNHNAVTPFSLMALIDDPQTQYNATKKYADFNFPKSANSLPINPYLSHKKIRIGYFSADFKLHPVATLTAELYETHDRKSFEIYAFSFGPNTNDEMNLRIKAGVDHFYDVREKSDKEVVLLARSLEIDIAIDLSGYTADSRTSIFAMSAAPIQASYIGVLSTMGAKYYNYLIAGKSMIPKENQKYFTEKIVYLPSYQVNDSKEPLPELSFTRDDFHLPTNFFIFCCFNSAFKLNPSIFDSWARILKAVNKSVLFLAIDEEEIRLNLINEISQRGIDSKRLIFGDRIPRPEYLARYKVADLFLDTRPYNAGTTASDALRMGLPVLTLKGQSFNSREASSVLNSLNMHELITTSEVEYESLAIELASNPTKLKIIKDRLMENLSSAPLYNTPLFTKNLETAYKKMFNRCQMGLEPDHIYVD